MIRAVSASSGHNIGNMTTALLHLQDLLDRFERWFNDRFGWFFTNGMKGRTRRPRVY